MTDDSRKQQLLGTPAKLPLSVAIQIAYGSIRVRLSRSLVTVSSVVLAVTFLLVVLGGEISSNAVFRTWTRDVRPAEDAARIRTLLVQPRDILGLMAMLRDEPEATKDWAQSLDVSVQLPGREIAAEALVVARWLQSLRPSQRYLMVRNQGIGPWLLTYNSAGTSAADRAIEASAEEPGEYDHLPPKVASFIEVGSTLTGTRLPLSHEELLAVAENMPILATAIRQLQEAEQRRLAQVRAAGGVEPVIERLRGGAEDQQLAEIGLPLSQLIPQISSTRRQELVAQVEIEDLRTRAQAVLARPRVITDEDGNEEIAPLLGLGALIDGRLDGHPFSSEIDSELQAAIGAAAIDRLRQDLLRRRTLDGLRATFASMNYDPDAGKERTLWLVLLSLLVCIVGIVNSMMMAVTERFREIATMKCLGAMDGFILKTFMIESGSVGFVGAILGALIGVVLVLGQSTARYGASFWASLPAQYLLMAAIASLVCGLFLTILGALLPAYKAARMNPIEAMRLEA
ncbi:MAG: ABC transporter permease [Planctomycetota bacterium]|nr:MAG: ABC transporter permease [Planctomycetota bacterium]